MKWFLYYSNQVSFTKYGRMVTLKKFLVWGPRGGRVGILKHFPNLGVGGAGGWQSQHSNVWGEPIWAPTRFSIMRRGGEGRSLGISRFSLLHISFPKANTKFRRGGGVEKPPSREKSRSFILYRTSPHSLYVSHQLSMFPGNKIVGYQKFWTSTPPPSHTSF